MNRKQTFAPVKGAPPSVEYVGVGELHVDETYQRSTDNGASRALIASIAAGWDWRLCMPLVVSRRAEGNYVIDGQHRLEAAKRRGDIAHLPCCLARYDGPADEARLFVTANRARRAINRLDDFHAALTAADTEALEVKRLIEEAGLSVARSTSSTAWKPGEVAFIGNVASKRRKHGNAIVSAALTNMAEAFPNEVLTHGGSIFGAIVSIMATPPEGFDPDRLFQALLTFTVTGWGDFVERLKGGDTRAQAMRSAMLEAYKDVPAETAESFA